MLFSECILDLYLLIFLSSQNYSYIIITVCYNIVMDYKFYSTQDTELNRYISTINYVLRGLYGNPYFYIVKSLPYKGKEKCIYIPSIKSVSVGVIKELARENNFLYDEILNYRVMESNNITKVIKEQLQSVSKNKVLRIQNIWNSYKKEFESIMNDFLDNDLLNKINRVDVIVTKVGSLGSYSRLKSDGSIQIVYREDVDISVIAESILTSFIRETDILKNPFIKMQQMKTVDWLIQENVVDFIMRTPKLKKLFPGYITTMNASLVDKESDLYQQTKMYLTELGLPQEQALKIKNGSVYYAIDNKELKGLTQQEEKLLKLLIEKVGHTVSYDEIAEVLWEEDYINKFSLNAINKLVYELRAKLRLLKVTGVILHTVRGKGYRLEA